MSYRPLQGPSPVPIRSWLTVALLCLVALLLGVLVAPLATSAAPASSSEGQAAGVIAVTSAVDLDSLLYLVDTNREVVLVYGYHVPAPRIGSGGARSGEFEFLAGRLYRWDALLAAKREYSMKGIKSLQGLRVDGPDGARSLVEKEAPSR
jgi:hypothetical protein